MKIKKLEGHEPITDWWLKFNELVTVLESRHGRSLPRITESHALHKAFECTNALIDSVNELNINNRNDDESA